MNQPSGVIQAPGNVMGASGNGAVDFTNQGRVIGNLIFAGGNDALHLYTGSTISGSINGGGGNNLMTLNGPAADRCERQRISCSLYLRSVAPGYQHSYFQQTAS
jgi:hypothetical protein